MITQIKKCVARIAASDNVPASVVSRFEVLVDDLRSSSSINELGLSALYVELRRALYYWQLGLTPTKLTAPILLIGGAPRSGTTFLQHCLVEAIGLPGVCSWELEPPALKSRRRGAAAAQRNAAQRFGLVSTFTPEVAAMHSLRAEGLDECTPLLAAAGIAPEFLMMAGLPGYGKMLASETNGSHFIWETVLDRIVTQRDTEGAHTVIPTVVKSPFHFVGYSEMGVDTCNSVAAVVHVRRPPGECFRSFLNMAFHLRRRFEDNLDPGSLGPELLAALVPLFDRSHRICRGPGFPLEQVDYADLISDPVLTLQGLCERLELPLARSVDQRRASLVSVDHSERRAGYALHELEFFGVTTRQVEAALAPFSTFFSGASDLSGV